MRHKKKGRKLKRTSSHKKALMRSLASSLFEHKKISTTVAKAKELRPYAEKLITKAKHAVQNEKQGLLPEGQTIDIHNRRMVYKNIRKKAIVQELFDVIAPLVEERDGGYTRIIKTVNRRGDGASLAIIELVDWSNPKDGASSLKSKKKRKKQAKKVKEEVEATEATAEVDSEKIETFENIDAEEIVEETKKEETEAEDKKEETKAEVKEEEAKAEKKEEDSKESEEEK